MFNEEKDFLAKIESVEEAELGELFVYLFSFKELKYVRVHRLESTGCPIPPVWLAKFCIFIAEFVLYAAKIVFISNLIFAVRGAYVLKVVVVRLLNRIFCYKAEVACFMGVSRLGDILFLFVCFIITSGILCWYCLWFIWFQIDIFQMLLDGVVRVLEYGNNIDSSVLLDIIKNHLKNPLGK